jgi:hypothetical protein
MAEEDEEALVDADVVNGLQELPVRSWKLTDGTLVDLWEPRDLPPRPEIPIVIRPPVVRPGWMIRPISVPVWLIVYLLGFWAWHFFAGPLGWAWLQLLLQIAWYATIVVVLVQTWLFLRARHG